MANLKKLALIIGLHPIQVQQMKADLLPFPVDFVLGEGNLPVTDIPGITGRPAGKA